MNDKIKKQLGDDGFAVVGLEITDALTRLRADAYAVFNASRRGARQSGVTRDRDIIDFHRENQAGQHASVKACCSLPSLHALSSHTEILGCISGAGLRMPILDVAALMRCDMPIIGQRRFLRHQDYSYNIGSDNSVTIWIPLQDTGAQEGALLIVPGSHKNGIYPQQNGTITKDFEFDFVSCPVKFGQALIFDQKLVHESGTNQSDVIRFSVQIRYSDLSDPSYQSRGWPSNYRIQPLEYAAQTILTVPAE